MNVALKEAIARFVPPIVMDGWRALRHGAGDAGAASGAPEWEAVADSDSVWTAEAGWSHASIVQTQLDKWSEFVAGVEGARPIGVAHEAGPGAAPDVGPHNTVMTFGYILGQALAGRDRLSVLDWGGGLGHYAIYAKALYPGQTFDYVVKDLDGFCAAGRRLMPDVTYVSDDASAFAGRYDLVFASSSLHYTRGFYGQLEKVCASAARHLMITRIPVVAEHDDFVVVQRPRRYGYLTQYACWFVNRGRLIAFIERQGLKLKREFLLGERPHVPNAPEQCFYGGFLFEREQTHG